MLLFVKTLIVMLQGLGITEHLLQFGEYPVDDNLFLGSWGLNRFMFTNIAYYLFSLLDKEKADERFGLLMPVENPDEYHAFVQRTVTWLQELSRNFTLLRYVPLSSNVFHDCSGPLMHQVMFAFTMAVVKNTVFDRGETMLCPKFKKSNYVANYKLFMDMVTDRNNLNRKSFEADLFEHLLTYVYGEDSKDMILENEPRRANDGRMPVPVPNLLRQRNSPGQRDTANIVSPSTQSSHAQNSNRLDTVYPLAHRGQRIKPRRPFFMQKSPLNENRVLLPVPTRSISDANLSSCHGKEVSLYVPVMRRYQHNIRLALEEHRLEAERLAAAKKEEEQRLADQKEAREQGFFRKIISATRRTLQTRGLVAENEVQEQSSAVGKEMQEEGGSSTQGVQSDKENYRGTKRKSEEIQGSSSSPNQKRRTLFYII